jgi:hypothetical protein
MMARTMILPPRRSDPLWLVKTYVDRRVGLIDPARQRRRQRTATQAIRR